MPLLGRLFTRKNKNSPRGTVNDDSQGFSTLDSPTAVSDSNHSSHTASSYVTPDISTPSDPNSGRRLRLFSRKKSSIASANLAPSHDFSTPQRPAFPRLSDGDTDTLDSRRLRPPPSRSAIFAAYADPGSALSTRSLPENPVQQKANSSIPPLAPSLPQKRPSFFAWAKTSSNSSLKSTKDYDVPFNTQSDSSESRIDGSFSLKSFTHIRPPPPFDSSDISLVPPIPRPRGTSIHSDSSQRISVAAFREVQARRSQSGSPVPSPRESSPIPLISAQGAKTPGVIRTVGTGPRISRSSAALLQYDHTKRPSTAMVSTSDEDDSSGNSSEGEGVRRKENNSFRPGKSKSKSKSETGHGSTSPFKSNSAPPLPKASRSHVGHSSNPRPSSHFELKDDTTKLMHPRSQSSLGVYAHGRQSSSTSTLTSATATHQQSASVPNNPRNPTPRNLPLSQLESNQQKTKPTIQPPPRDSSDSDDDAPLASLVAPRRPGSAVSSYSNPRSTSGHSQVTARLPIYSKPLIDVHEVITSKPTSATSPPSDAGFTQGPTLLSCGKSATTTTYGTLQVVESPKLGDSKPFAQVGTPVKFASPPSSPKEMKALLAQSSEATRNSDLSDSPSHKTLQNTETATGEQKRDPLSDRLSRAVKKSLISPLTSSATYSSPPDPQIASNPKERSPISGAASPEGLQTRRSVDASRLVLPRHSAPVALSSPEDYSPADEDLANLLGTAAIKFISRTGESPEESSDSDSSPEEAKQKETDRIAPIPIKHRSPPAAFTVTSRPPFPKQQEQQSHDAPSRTKTPPNPTETRAFQAAKTHSSERQQNLTTFPSSRSVPPSSNTPSTGGGIITRSSSGTTTVQPGLVRQRSNTMAFGMPSRAQRPLDRNQVTMRGNSPSSSTGDSSSGRVPHTPRDGSDLGVQNEGRKKVVHTNVPVETSGILGGKRQKAHVKRRSVSFDDKLHELNSRPSRSHIREGAMVGSDNLGARHLREGAGISLDNRELSDEEKEARRRERRRKEAMNAIELGNVIHGPPPILDEDNNDMAINQARGARLSSFNPLIGSPMTMPMGFGSNGSWVPGMPSPTQFMIPRPSDPNLLLAHQQAMMYAKQAYQMAVAQQAMAAAGEEWERGSTVGGFGSSGSVYGGSTAPPIMNTSLGIMQGMGMMGPSASVGWSSSASVYGGMGAIPRFGSHLSPADAMLSGSRSDYGGATSTRNSANWSYSRGLYGESFGATNGSSDKSSRRGGGSQQQQSTTMGSHRTLGRDWSTSPPAPPIPASHGANGRRSPEFRGPTRLRTSSQPATPTRTNVLPRKAPPSSWRLAGA